MTKPVIASPWGKLSIQNLNRKTIWSIFTSKGVTTGGGVLRTPSTLATANRISLLTSSIDADKGIGNSTFLTTPDTGRLKFVIRELVEKGSGLSRQISNQRREQQSKKKQPKRNIDFGEKLFFQNQIFNEM